MIMTSNPAILRALVGTVGALLLGTLCLGTAVGPAQATTVSVSARIA